MTQLSLTTTDSELTYTLASYYYYYYYYHLTASSRTTWVSRFQKGKTNLDFTAARDSEWQWRQLGHMQVCTSLQTDNHANTPSLCFFTGRMPFLPPNQQRRSTEGRTEKKLKARSRKNDACRLRRCDAQSCRTIAAACSRERF